MFSYFLNLAAQWGKQQLSNDLFEWLPIVGDASTRRYFRIQSNQRSFVLIYNFLTYGYCNLGNCQIKFEFLHKHFLKRTIVTLSYKTTRH